MRKRKFKIVKLTPIALASCEACNTTFHSCQRVEDEAEREMKALFDRHDCEAEHLAGMTEPGRPTD